MSLTITVIDKTADQMIIISDKRLTGFKGKVTFFENDNYIKHHLINDRLCFSPGSYFNHESKPDQRLATMLQFSDKPSNLLFELAQRIERRYKNLDGFIIYDHIQLSGLNDNNEFFILSGQPDGSFTCTYEKIGNYKLTIMTNGDHLQRPIGEFLTERLIDKRETLLQALKKTVVYASKIESTISPTYNYSIIKKI